MLRTQVIGCGAAGNKATIEAVESGVLQSSKSSYLLLNTTEKDIPHDYRDHAIIFGDNGGGCGKERDLGKRMLINDEKNGIRSIENKIDPYAEFIIVCGSTEGGSGSASIPLVTKYISQVMHIPCIAVLFFGFNDDARGMQNSIEICQELEENIGVISICNSKFLVEARNNKLIAERLANKYFCNIVRYLIGANIYESSQNIDNTDLKKVILTPGYISIEKIDIPSGINNTQQYEQAILSSIDESKSMKPGKKSAKRIACIFNVEPETDYIDYSCNVFKDKYGMPYELFTHIQYADDGRYVIVIASGGDLPIGEVKEIFNRYKEASKSVKRDTDEFFKSVSSMRGNPDDAAFNMFSNSKSKTQVKQSDRDAFFKSFGADTPKAPKSEDIFEDQKDEPKVKDSKSDY